MRSLKLEKRASIGAVTGPTGLLLGLVAVIIAMNSPAAAAGHHSAHKITAKQLAPGSVTSKAIRKGAVGTKALGEGVVTNAALADNSVNARTLGEGSVTERAIAPAAVTHGAIAPGSVSSSTLTTETINVAPITDLDAVAENGTWTPSNTEVASCKPGEDVLGTGFMFTEPGNHEVSFLRVQPAISATGDGVAGEISSNSGGTAKAQIMVVCLGP